MAQGRRWVTPTKVRVVVVPMLGMGSQGRTSRGELGCAARLARGPTGKGHRVENAPYIPLALRLPGR